MNMLELVTLLDGVGQYFGKKFCNSGQLESWLEVLKGVPSGSVGFIKEEICKNCSRLPENLPPVILEHARRWVESRPHATEPEIIGCSYCQNGVLWLVHESGRSGVTCCTCHPRPGELGRVDPRYLPSGWRFRSIPERGSGVGVPYEPSLSDVAARAQSGSGLVVYPVRIAS